jgi:dihydrodipicolinate synthase/N-acetylneuraminate lyase
LGGVSFSFEGVIPAVWTPTDGAGALLKEALRSNIQFLVGSGVDALLVLGSTGEFIQLSVGERKEVLDCAIKFARGIPVGVNISHTNPRAVAELSRHARTAGAGAVMLLPPWFYPMNDDDLVAFYGRAGGASDLPLGLYNFPNLTGKRLTPELVRAIAKETRVTGLKQSGGDFAEHQPLVGLGREVGFKVMTGWDTCIPEAMAVGAKGCIGGLGNLVPEIMVKIHRLVSMGRTAELDAPAQLMKRIGALINTLEFPLNIAAGMAARGLATGEMKQVLSASSQARYETLRDGLRRLFEEHNLPPA